MRKRTAFSTKEKRRDQRRPVSIAGSLDGAPVDLFDLSFGGLGGRADVRANTAELNFQEGQRVTFTFSGPNNKPVAWKVMIQRVDPRVGEFGATFVGLSSKQFDLIENLMFPHRGSR